METQDEENVPQEAMFRLLDQDQLSWASSVSAAAILSRGRTKGQVRGPILEMKPQPVKFNTSEENKKTASGNVHVCFE